MSGSDHRRDAGKHADAATGTASGATVPARSHRRRAARRASWRYAWAAPCTLLGLAFAALPWALGLAQAQVVDGVLEIALRNASRFTRRCLPFNAITFGHCVLALDPGCLAPLRAHEHAHVRQYERWGAAFLLAYPLASLWQVLRGKRAYLDNPFEVQARDAARHG